jgi:arsenite methyltransferase
MNAEEAKIFVRQRYAAIAKQSRCCCGPATSSCCGSGADNDSSRHTGYSEDDIKSIPEGANLGLGEK